MFRHHPLAQAACAVRQHSMRRVLVARASGAASSSGDGPSAAIPPRQGHRGHVLVVPAFYLDSAVFAPLVAELRAQGYNAALPPIRWCVDPVHLRDAPLPCHDQCNT